MQALLDGRNDITYHFEGASALGSAPVDLEFHRPARYIQHPHSLRGQGTGRVIPNRLQIT